MYTLTSSAARYMCRPYIYLLKMRGKNVAVESVLFIQTCETYQIAKLSNFAFARDENEAYFAKTKIEIKTLKT